MTPINTRAQRFDRSPGAPQVPKSVLIDKCMRSIMLFLNDKTAPIPVTQGKEKWQSLPRASARLPGFLHECQNGVGIQIGIVRHVNQPLQVKYLES